MTAKDLTRADVRKAVDDARVALAALNHVAMAGVLHVNLTDDSRRAQLSMLTNAHTSALSIVALMVDAASQLPIGTE